MNNIIEQMLTQHETATLFDKKNGIKEERNRAVAQAAVRQRIMQKKTESAASTTPAEK